MKVAVIGASGFVGSHLVKELTDRGHEVKGIARDPGKITFRHANFTAVKADVFNEAELVEQLKGVDAVASTYNAGWENPDLYADFLKGSEAIRSAVKKAGIKRYITVGGAGSLYIAEGLQLVDSPDFPAEWKAGAMAARDYLTSLKKEQELDWTFLSPAIEMHPGTSGVRKGTYRTALENPVVDENGKSVISAEDLVVAIVDELETPKHIRQRFTVAY